MKKLLSIILVAVSIVTAMTLGAFEFKASAETPEEQFTYEVKNGKATIKGYKNLLSADVTIPSTLGGYPVTSIGDYNFR